MLSTLGESKLEDLSKLRFEHWFEDAQTAIDFGTADEIDFKAANAANPSPCTAGETLAPEQIGENPISRNGENRKCRERNF